MKLAIIFGDPSKNILARLTKWFTGCTAYHVAFVDEETQSMYDMYWIRRKRTWPYYENYILYDMPCVTWEYLEDRLKNDKSEYGFKDYLLFGLRPLFHLFGKSTINAGGVICSEMVNNDIIACGGTTPFDPKKAPPSPCDLYNWLKNA